MPTLSWEVQITRWLFLPYGPLHKGKRSLCPKCGVLLPEKSIWNHMRRHSAQKLLDQARRFHLKLAARQRYFAYTFRRLAGRYPAAKATGPTPASQLAPAKLKCFKSPRGSPRPEQESRKKTKVPKNVVFAYNM